MTLDEDGNVAGYDDYYPFGMVMPGRSMNNSNPNSIYKFTGKERDEETNYDYFGARYYDSRIGRWLSVDPLADKYPGLSPYNYCINNPMIFIDPDGADIFKPSDKIAAYLRNAYRYSSTYRKWHNSILGNHKVNWVFTEKSSGGNFYAKTETAYYPGATYEQMSLTTINSSHQEEFFPLPNENATGMMTNEIAHVIEAIYAGDEETLKWYFENYDIIDADKAACTEFATGEDNKAKKEYWKEENRLNLSDDELDKLMWTESKKVER